MPRLQRLPSITFGWYVIVMRAVSDRQLIIDTADLTSLVQLLLADLRGHDARLHAAAVTPREVHVLIQNGERAVHEITRSFCNKYARRFNRAHNEAGSLFQSHPRILLIEHQTWLVPAAHVIHWIPLLRGSPGKFCWTTDSVYRDRGRREGIITHAMLHFLTRGARNRDLQQTAYRERFDQRPSPQTILALERGAPGDSRILGSAAFMDDTCRRTGQLPLRRRRPAPLTDEALQRAVAAMLERFAVLCEGRLEPRRAAHWKRIATLERLRSRSREAPLPLIRALVASYAIERGLATQAQIAHYFGCHRKNLSAQRRRSLELRWTKILGRPVNSGAS